MEIVGTSKIDKVFYYWHKSVSFLFSTVMYSICVKQDILVGSKVTFLQVQKCKGMEISTFNACLGQGKKYYLPKWQFLLVQLFKEV